MLFFSRAIRLKLILINSSLILRYSFRFMENCLNVPTYLLSNFFLTVSNAAAVFTNFQSPLSPYMLNFNFCSSLCLGVFGIFGAHAIETAFKLVNVALSPSIALPLLYYSSSSQFLHFYLQFLKFYLFCHCSNSSFCISFSSHRSLHLSILALNSLFLNKVVILCRRKFVFTGKKLTSLNKKA